MQADIQFFDVSEVCGFWVCLWKTRTFPQSPQVFPQAVFTAGIEAYPFLVDIMTCGAVRQISHFSACQKNGSPAAMVRKIGLDKPVLSWMGGKGCWIGGRFCAAGSAFGQISKKILKKGIDFP